MKLNKLIYITLILIISSCEDQLELVPQRSFTPQGFFETEEEIKRGVIAAYQTNRSLHNSLQWRMGEFRSDNTSFQYGTDRGGEIALESVDEFLMDAGNKQLGDYWSTCYSGISRCNYVLNNIEGVRFLDGSDKEATRGEALFLRSWFYFNLARLYGDIPYSTIVFTSPDEALTDTFLEPLAVNQVYDSIKLDAQRAIDALPVSWDDSNTGRATRGAALMLKAKIHMTLNETSEFQQAIPLLEELTTLGYDLLDNYQEIFNPDNKNHEESIFEIQYSVEFGQAANFIGEFVPINSGTDILGVDFNINAGGRAGRNQPTTDLIELYRDGDLRKDINIAQYIDLGEDEDDPSDNDTIPYLNKYNYPILASNSDQVIQQDVNWPMFRYADALLMLAECYTEVNGVDQNAIGILNIIRLRAETPPYSDASNDPSLVLNTVDDLLNAIETERRLELAFENHRWFDLIRTGKAVEVMTAHGIRQKAEKGVAGELLPDGTEGTVSANAYTNIRTVLGIPAGQVMRFGYDQKANW